MSEELRSPEPQKKDEEKEDYMDFMLNELESMECFHGNILEEDLKNILQTHGDFVLRTKVAADGKKDIMVTLLWKEELYDIKMKAKLLPEKEKNGDPKLSYQLDTKTRQNTIKDLIKKHQTQGLPIDIKAKNGLLLLNPIAKQSWELKRDNIELIKKLGEGAFGEVHSGKLKMRFGKTVNVAVKVIKRCANNEKATQELQKEGSLMRKFKHENVVRTFGMVIERDTIMVVMELIVGGGLDEYLKKNPTPPELKASFAYDIACGLSYVHNLHCIHRDIACRNCLLDVGRKNAKLSDFGLTRRTDKYCIQDGDKLPVRWLAPEVIETKEYTTWADIYAYAILVWEIFSNGALPFGPKSNAEIKEGIKTEAFRPEIPADTPPEAAKVMKQCWAGKADSRMPLKTVIKTLVKFKKVEEKTKKSDEPSTSTEKPQAKSGVLSSVKKTRRGKKGSKK